MECYNQCYNKNTVIDEFRKPIDHKIAMCTREKLKCSLVNIIDFLSTDSNGLYLNRLCIEPILAIQFSYYILRWPKKKKKLNKMSYILAIFC